MEDLIKIHEDFDTFGRALIASKDVDPVYPLIPKLIKNGSFEKQWFVFCYAAFYSLESGIIMCEEMRTRGKWDKDLFRELRSGKLTKFGHERRGTARNVDVQINMFNEIVNWLDLFVTEALSDGSLHFRKRIEELPNHGGWAAFKIAEIYEKSLGFSQLSIPDLGLDGRDPNSTDGPVAGLRWLFGRDEYYEKDIFPIWNKFGSDLANEWGVDIGEVETCLCKFHKFKTGKYYIGHDIHEFYDLTHVITSDEYADIMGDLFDDKIWWNVKGVQKQVKNKYLNTGEIINKEFAQAIPKADITDIILEL
jgi:Alpha-glutamyl/putrescinyl thymine pyrophosphorylase clade 2